MSLSPQQLQKTALFSLRYGTQFSKGLTMGIELAPDNHIAELELVDGFLKEVSVIETLEDFKGSCNSTAFSSDETAHWCCVHEGKHYIGDTMIPEHIGDSAYHPTWATHILWYGK